MRARARCARLDFAVKNATDGPITTPLADVPSDGFSLGIRTNINGTFYGMKHGVPAMLASGGGVMTNTALRSWHRRCEQSFGIVSGKAEIIGLSRSAALDYAVQGIRIKVMAPDPILTDHLRPRRRARPADGGAERADWTDRDDI